MVNITSRELGVICSIKHLLRKYLQRYLGKKGSLYMHMGLNVYTQTLHTYIKKEKPSYKGITESKTAV